MGYHYIYRADATTTTNDTTDTDVSYEAEANDQPIITDPNLEVEQVVEGLELPTTMAFLGPNDILVLEKDKGTVQRIVSGNIMPEPLLDVNVATTNERGMLGIAVTSEKNLLHGNQSSSSSSTITTNPYVFLYFTESGSEEDGNDGCSKASRSCNTSSPLPNGNRLYRYELVANKLVNPMLLLNLPAIPGPSHNGGAIMIGPDNNLYIPIGDVDGSGNGKETKAQNYVNGIEPDGRGGILRITQDGRPIELSSNGAGAGGDHGIFGDSSPLNLYYAYGIRNSFGIDFDPITGNLWDTENGPGSNDEINLIEPGFNSGWKPITGIASLDPGFDPDTDLVNFDGKGIYSDPKFVWSGTPGPTAIKFLNSDKYGKQYENDTFVGDFHNGNLYHFKLNKDRTGLALDPKIAGGTTDAELESSSIVFGKGFGGITDIDVGPDGYLYVVSIGLGKIFKIVPKVNNNNGEVE